MTKGREHEEVTYAVAARVPERLGDLSSSRLGNLIALARQVYDDREKYDLSMKATDARVKELE